MKSGTAFVVVVLAVVVGTAGCGTGSDKTYAYRPTYACLERLETVNGLPVVVKSRNDTMLGEGAGGYQFMVFFGDPDAGYSNVVYADMLRSPDEARKAVRDYKQHAADGEMGYSADADVSRKGNVALVWSAGLESAFKQAFERCLT